MCVCLFNLVSRQSSSVMDHIEKPDDLLEETWFFGNLLDKKAKTKTKAKAKTMSRSYSDPCPMENEKLSKTKGHNLMRAPSLPPSIEREIDSGSKGKSGLRKLQTSLHRAPSLPPCIGRDEDAESEFSLSRLIRQASLSSSDELPPKHNSKGIKQGSSAPRYRPQAKPLPEKNEIQAFDEMRNQSIKVQSKLRRSMSDVKLQQVEGLENTCYKFDKTYTNPLVIPCFQDKPRTVYDESSSSENMKNQIKYWARAVAANVR